VTGPAAALYAAVRAYLAECSQADIPGTVPRDGMEVAALAYLRSGGQDGAVRWLAQRVLLDLPVTDADLP
jgi:hypothetical protein